MPDQHVKSAIGFVPNDREAEAIEQLCRETGLSPERLLRQALRTYQAVQRAQHLGEPVVIGWGHPKVDHSLPSQRQVFKTPSQAIAHLSFLSEEQRASAVTVAFAPVSYAEGVVIATEEADGLTIPIAAGERLELRLRSLASCGYLWELLDHGGLGEVEQRHVAVDPDLVGEGGDEVYAWDLAGRDAGTYTIVLRNRRPFETGDGRRLTVRLIVTPSRG